MQYCFLAGNTRANAETVRGNTDKMTRNWRLGAAAEDNTIAERVGEVATQLGVPMAAVALAWVLAKPGITAPIIGVSKPHRLDDALKSLEVKLDAQTMKYLEEPYRPKAIAAHE